LYQKQRHRLDRHPRQSIDTHAKGHQDIGPNVTEHPNNPKWRSPMDAERPWRVLGRPDALAIGFAQKLACVLQKPQTHFDQGWVTMAKEIEGDPLRAAAAERAQEQQDTNRASLGR
jgi:hypothetical protein